ncbi:MAG: hypothetical protein H6Q73_4354 [Firmicutes bacterium]|nr:hypothetical protein [Bacillota bacterium]
MVNSIIPSQQLRAIPIIDIWRKYNGGDLTRRGKELAGRCSRHGSDSEPSLMIDQEKNSFYCHGCQAGGDCIELATWLLDSDFKTTAAKLAEDFSAGISVRQTKKKIAAEYNYLDENGEIVFQAVRMVPKDFRQRRPDGQGGWIWDLKGVGLIPYNLPVIMAAMGQGEPIYIVEGEKDVQSLTAIGIAATCNSGGAGKWKEVHSKYIQPGRLIIILPDNDEPGRKHAADVAQQLHNRDSKVKIVNLPGLAPKGDISDWLTVGHTKDELLNIVDAAEYWEPEKVPEVDEKYTEWRELYKGTGFTVDRWGRLCQIKATKDGSEERPLAEFVARIIREVTRDNGHEEETKIAFEIEGRLPNGKLLPPRIVNAAEFSAMNWPLKAWGADALVLAGSAIKDALRVAIQATAKVAKKDQLYCHTGWRQIDGRWVYLHGGGVIGTNNLQVDLSEGGQQLARYKLPDTVADIQAAGRVAVRLMDIADRRVTLPLLATVFLTPLCDLMRRMGHEPTFLVWLYGHTGQRKSSIAAMFLCFFGNFSRDSLPANFRDTKNMTEKLTFLLKDSLLVVDDFHPVANAKDRAEMTGKAQSLLRAYGDRAARGRMNADTTLKAGYPPRGMCIVTGEDIPDVGESGAARMVAVEIPRGGVNLEVLSECQEMVTMLPEFMRGYLIWLSGRLDHVDEESKVFRDLRKAAQANTHGRIPEIVAWLTMGMISGATYLESIGTINAIEKDSIVKNTWDILLKLAKDQAEQVREAKPSERFITGLRELMNSEAVQILSIDAFTIKDEQRFIGWFDDGFLYLLPGRVYGAIQQHFREQGREIGVSDTMLWKHLDADGYIEAVTTKDRRERSRLKKINGNSVRVLHFYRNKLKNVEGL